MSATVGAPLSATELPAEVRAGPRGQPADAASAPAHTLSHDERAAAGRALRDKFPRTQHATWKKSETRTDPIDLLRAVGCRPAAGPCADPLRPHARSRRSPSIAAPPG